MARNDLTAQQVRELLDYDPESGVLRWRKQVAQRVKIGDPAGNLRSTGYICITITTAPRQSFWYLAHRLVWLHVHGEWPVGDVDHINGNRSDNRIENLRNVARVINCQNRRGARSDSQTGLLGVKRASCGNGWQARITIPGHRSKHLGTFRTPEEAHAAYVQAKRRLHEGCTI